MGPGSALAPRARLAGTRWSLRTKHNLERATATASRRIHAAGEHPYGASRYPSTYPHADFDFARLKRFVQTLKRGQFDAFFMADHLALLDMRSRHSSAATRSPFEPFTLSPGSVVTERIGLMATASTTFDEPFHVARRFASLDHISGGAPAERQPPARARARISNPDTHTYRLRPRGGNMVSTRPPAPTHTHTRFFDTW